MLLTSITSELDAARLCAAQWAQRLFPFSFPAARYICCLACGDASLQVRESGAAGLKPPSMSNATAGLSNGSAAAAADSQQAYPQLEAMVAYACSKQGRLRQAAQHTEALVLPAKAFLALVQLLRKCQEAGGEAASDDATTDSYLGDDSQA